MVRKAEKIVKVGLFSLVGRIKHLFVRALAVGGAGILRVVEAMVKIRIGRLHFERIGHLAVNTELYLRRRLRDQDSGRKYDIFVTGQPANRHLLTMIKRRLTVIEGRILGRVYDALKTQSKNFDCWVELPMNSNEFDEFNNLPPQLTFTAKEEAHGKQVLTSMGIEHGTPFVCIHARDSAYLDTLHGWRSRDDWAYHDYRNCKIFNYLPAAEHLASLGVFAVRMGYVVEDALTLKTDRIIDYATLYRSDFGDVYLPAKCKFFIGSTAGLVCIPYIFNVPVAFANMVPFGYASLGKQDIFIPKKLWSCEKKRFLTFREIVASGADRWQRSDDYRQMGIELIENTGEEILALAKEMNERLDGNCVSSEEDDELQQRFRALFGLEHRSHGFPSRVGAEFLRQNRELLD